MYSEALNLNKKHPEPAKPFSFAWDRSAYAPVRQSQPFLAPWGATKPNYGLQAIQLSADTPQPRFAMESAPESIGRIGSG
jgi:hypothetical protein